MFRVGQKVARKKLTEPPAESIVWLAAHGVGFPSAGEVCTVTAVGDNHIHLAEYPQPGVLGFSPGWRADAFEPIVETDISIFTAMLNPSRKTERA